MRHNPFSSPPPTPPESTPNRAARHRFGGNAIRLGAATAVVGASLGLIAVNSASAAGGANATGFYPVPGAVSNFVGPAGFCISPGAAVPDAVPGNYVDTGGGVSGPLQTDAWLGGLTAGGADFPPAGMTFGGGLVPDNSTDFTASVDGSLQDAFTGGGDHSGTETPNVTAFGNAFPAPWSLISNAPPGPYVAGQTYNGDVQITAANGAAVPLSIAINVAISGNGSLILGNGGVTNATGDLPYTFSVPAGGAVGGTFSLPNMPGQSDVWAAPGESGEQNVVVPESETLGTSMSGGATAPAQTFGGLLVVKDDAADGQGLGGAVFNVVGPQYPNGQDFETVYTAGTTSVGANGTTVNYPAGATLVTDILTGQYTVTEVKAPAGYQINPTPQTVTVTADPSDPPTGPGSSAVDEVLTFVDNAEPGGLQILKQDSSTFAPLAGATFTVTGPAAGTQPPDEAIPEPGMVNDTAGGTYTTGSNGITDATDLEPGQYTVTETGAPAGYNTAAPQTVTVTPESSAGAPNPNATTTQVVFNDTPSFLPPVTILKESTDPNVGVGGTVISLSGPDGPVTGSPFTVPANGTIGPITKLPPGTYTATETQAAPGLQVAPPQTVTLGVTDPAHTFTFDDSAVPGALSIKKVDSDTQTGLAGATFSVAYDATGAPGDYSQPIAGPDADGTFTSGTNGDVIDPAGALNSLQPGPYQVTEVTAPGGHALPADPVQDVTVTSGSTASAPVVATFSDLTVPTITTTASAGGGLGTSISDTARFAGSEHAGGTITFNAYGPFASQSAASTANASCTAADLAFTSQPVTVQGSGTYSMPGSFAPSKPGIYDWIEVYSGDSNNVPAAGHCGDSNESSTVVAITTKATALAAVGTPISDTAIVTGPTDLTGSVTFAAYPQVGGAGTGTTPAVCGTPAFVSKPVAVSGPGDYPEADSYTPAAGELVEWIETFTGSGSYAGVAVTGHCGDSGESSRVVGVSTTATPTAALGGPISDTALVTGPADMTGSVTFAAYPQSGTTASCTTPAFTSAPVATAGPGTYPEADSFTPATPGDVDWVETWTGSGAYVGLVVTGHCGDSSETSRIVQVTTSATPLALVGGPISDTATVAGGPETAGTVVFRAYQETDGTADSCTAANLAFTSQPVTVSGPGKYPMADSFDTKNAALYDWIETFTGSGPDQGLVVTGKCGDSTEQSRVVQVTTTAAATQTLGGPVSDTALVAGPSDVTGTVNFTAYVQTGNTPNCNTANFTSATVSVNGPGAYPMVDSFTPTQAGDVEWIEHFTGTGTYQGLTATGSCGDTKEVSQVVQITTHATPTAVLGSPIADTAVVSGPSNIEGIITFAAYPQAAGTTTANSVCAAPAFVSEGVQVNGPGSYPETDSYTPTSAVPVEWIETFHGTGAYLGLTVSGRCGDVGEESTIIPAPKQGPQGSSGQNAVSKGGSGENGGSIQTDLGRWTPGGTSSVIGIEAGLGLAIAGGLAFGLTRRRRNAA